ncbi:glycosyltransferase [Gordonia sp. L191]|uniref:glycosyltransferase n=1 Tax=Gordonia sp. L191 TaxID=2982699 RepID=UPI0024BF226D|nr:glycosyltransferase [Gordonia sp. L191]WHU46581.1 glycosyltransferase [Gordonia sp. L191]
MQQEIDRMLVQRTLFAGPNPRVVPGMYVDANAALVRSDRTTVRMEPGAILSTNTYFGRFAASYWQRYTTISSVRLEFDHECAPDAQLRVEIKASDPSGRWRPIDAVEVTGRGRAVLDLDVRRFVDGGAIWFDATAIGGGARISEVTWSVPRPQRNRLMSVVMCTHNRPADAISTLLTLASDPVALDLIDSVYVVDQGTARVDAHDDFSKVKDVLGPRLQYLIQPNLGGAGGFNRGIHELTKSGECETDIVVMDDDILCEPESVVRLSALANNASRPVIVGAQMLLLSETYRVHMTSEWEALDELKAGTPGAFGKSGLNALKKHQDARSDAGWNGWWTCLLPAEAVVAAGLSLPLFFQWDDIEFGIRARKAGFATVTLPNAGVWHADFHLKDYDDWSRYFSWRNALIVASIHGRFDPTEVATTVAREITGHIVSMQYGLAETFLLAVRDFMSGPSILADGGRTKLAELSELRSHYPDTVRHEAVEGLVGDPRIVTRGHEPQDNKLDQVMVKRVVQQVLGRVGGGRVAIPAHSARWWHVGLFAEAIVTDASQTGVRIRRRDKQIAVRQLRELTSLCLELRKNAPALAAQWQAALPELTSHENWQRLFDGD